MTEMNGPIKYKTGFKRPLPPPVLAPSWVKGSNNLPVNSCQGCQEQNNDNGDNYRLLHLDLWLLLITCKVTVGLNNKID